MFTDIGVNLMSPAFEKDRDFVVNRAIAAGVTTLVITGSSIASSEEAAEFAAAYTGAARVCATAGVHPHNAKDWIKSPRSHTENTEDTEITEERKGEGAVLTECAVTFPLSFVPLCLRESSSRIKSLRELAAKAVAVGECGLDYNRNFSPPDAQRKCFEDQLALALELNKPVFLHERDAFDDFYAILKQYRSDLPGAVVHCFTGGMKELETYLALDCYIGITGWVCDERRGGHLLSLLRHIPANRLLLETDAPYLLPRTLPKSVKGKSGRNEPCFLPHIASFVGEIVGKPMEQLAKETTRNATELFGIHS